MSQLDTQHGRKRSTGNLRDINAMSVASIYDREHNEIMDADKWVTLFASFLMGQSDLRMARLKVALQWIHRQMNMLNLFSMLVW